MRLPRESAVGVGTIRARREGLREAVGAESETIEEGVGGDRPERKKSTGRSKWEDEPKDDRGGGGEVGLLIEKRPPTGVKKEWELMEARLPRYRKG